jgi:hypothetical protein
MKEHPKNFLKFKIIIFVCTHVFFFGIIGIGYYLGKGMTQEELRGKRFENIEIEYMKFLKENEEGATDVEKRFLAYLELIYGM